MLLPCGLRRGQPLSGRGVRAGVVLYLHHFLVTLCRTSAKINLEAASEVRLGRIGDGKREGGRGPVDGDCPHVKSRSIKPKSKRVLDDDQIVSNRAEKLRQVCIGSERQKEPKKHGHGLADPIADRPQNP